MVRALVQVLVNAGAVWLAANYIPGVSYKGSVVSLLIAGLVIGLINLLVKPIVSFFSLPFIIVTLGLFYLLINGAMFYLAAYLLQGLAVDGCVPAILGGVLIALGNWLVRAFSSGD
jgi:putative membrane protein